MLTMLFCFDRFKYENSGKLTDTSSPPSLLQSVHQLIEVGYLHVTSLRFLTRICFVGTDLSLLGKSDSTIIITFVNALFYFNCFFFKCITLFVYLQEGQAAHFQRFLESEKGLNEAWKARKRLKTLQQEMETSLVSSYKDSPGNIELAR